MLTIELQMSWDVVECAPYTEGTIKMLLKEGGRQVPRLSSRPTPDPNSWAVPSSRWPSCRRMTLVQVVLQCNQ